MWHEKTLTPFLVAQKVWFRFVVVVANSHVTHCKAGKTINKSDVFFGVLPAVVAFYLFPSFNLNAFWRSSSFSRGCKLPLNRRLSNFLSLTYLDHWTVLYGAHPHTHVKWTENGDQLQFAPWLLLALAFLFGILIWFFYCFPFRFFCFFPAVCFFFFFFCTIGLWWCAHQCMNYVLSVWNKKSERTAIPTTATNNRNDLKMIRFNQSSVK